LKAVDWGRIAAHPKIFVGYSDLTSLMTWMVDSLGWITFHGPMVTKDFSHADGVDFESWGFALRGAGHWELGAPALEPVKPLVEGSAEGVLYGGCLSILVASLGTPFEIHCEDTILFIEDIAAKPYQIDRMLMQLKLAGKFDKVRGIVFGEMLDCYQTKAQDYTLEQVILRVVGDLGIPIAHGLRSGHVSRENVTLPLGIRAALKVGSQSVTLSFLESATMMDASISAAKF
jgi:muramoyltetrapeptide carboxypeptidase